MICDFQDKSFEIRPQVLKMSWKSGTRDIPKLISKSDTLAPDDSHPLKLTNVQISGSKIKQAGMYYSMYS